MKKLSALYPIVATYFARTPRKTIQFAILLLTALMLLASTQWGYACDPGISSCGGG